MCVGFKHLSDDEIASMDANRMTEDATDMLSQDWRNQPIQRVADDCGDETEWEIEPYVNDNMRVEFESRIDGCE